MKKFLKAIGSCVLAIGMFGAMLGVLGPVARAQGNGSVSGTVTDTTGAVIPDAEVTATQAGTGLQLKTSTSGAGTYVFPTLAPSVYNLAVSHAGFQTYRENALQVRADDALTANEALKAGSTAETVTVNAETVQVDTTTGTLSEVIGTSQVSGLPLNGRNAAALTAEVAGVTVAPYAQADQGNTKTFPTAYTISANGTFVGQTNYMLDGGNNVDEYTNINEPFPMPDSEGFVDIGVFVHVEPFPMPDSVQEFSVETSNYSAQYGQNAG